MQARLSPSSGRAKADRGPRRGEESAAAALYQGRAKPAAVAVSDRRRRHDGGGGAMYRWVYWSGIAVSVFWAAFSVYSVYKGL
jgi:hypothetical protein